MTEKTSHAKTGGRPPVLIYLVILFGAALIVRLVGIDWGGVNADENPGTAGKILSGQIVPDVQYYPPFLDYLIALADACYYGIGRVVGWWTSSVEFRAAYFEARTQFYLVGRAVTAALSATAAPIVFLLALDQGLKRRNAVIIALIVAFMPASVFWAHIAKSDSALGPAFLLVLLMGFRFLEAPSQILRQAGLAVSIALAVSFKQSAVFFLAPTLLIVFVGTLFSRIPILGVIRAWLSVTVLSAVIWMPLNLGILLNVKGFLDAQVVQSQMSLRDNSFSDSLAAWFASITSEQAGVPTFVLLLWFAVPIICLVATPKTNLRFRLLTVWASAAIAMIIILALAGSRQNGHLLLPYSVAIAVTVLLVGGWLVETHSRIAKACGSAILVAIAAFFSAETASVDLQARAQPVAKEVAAAIARFAPQGTRLLSDVPLSKYLPISSIGAEEMRARHERLAEKYKVVLPPVADESLRDVKDGYIVRNYPFVIGGLENVASSDLKIVLPFAWPLQPEEWKIGYWLDRNYRTFVFQESMLHHSVAAYRDFFQSIDRRCQRLAILPTLKPMFEDSVLIYRCT